MPFGEALLFLGHSQCSNIRLEGRSAGFLNVKVCNQLLLHLGLRFIEIHFMKNVVITGASKGIGYATALAFVKGGHRVLAIARNAKLLRKLQQEAAPLSGNIYIKECDITCFEPDLPEGFEKIDILILNAGKLINKAFAEISAEELRQVYEVNVFAPFRMVQKLLPDFSPEAHIINIGSVGGVNGTQKFPGLSAYSSSKAAASCLSECWQAEFAETDLAFNSLALGSVQTEMLNEAFPGYQAASTPQVMARYIFNFALEAPCVMKGKTVLVSSSNP